METTTATTNNTAVTVPNVVPWADRVAPPYVPPEEPVVSFPTDARPCEISELEVRAGDGGGGMGHTLSQFLFTNRSTTACVLDGYPTVAGVSANGDVTELTATHGTYFGDPGPPANLAPDEVAAVNVETEWPCKTDPSQSLVFPTLRLRLPSGDTVDVSGEKIDLFCGLWISRFGVPARTPPPTPIVVSPLTVTLAMPESLRSGEQELDYTVTITNTSSTPYRLDPCPTYTQGFYFQALGSSVDDYYLNCDAVSVIDVGQSITFEMRIAFATALPIGDGLKVGWSLHVTGDPRAGDALNVIA